MIKLTHSFSSFPTKLQSRLISSQEDNRRKPAISKASVLLLPSLLPVPGFLLLSPPQSKSHQALHCGQKLSLAGAPPHLFSLGVGGTCLKPTLGSQCGIRVQDLWWPREPSSTREGAADTVTSLGSPSHGNKMRWRAHCSGLTPFPWPVFTGANRMPDRKVGVKIARQGPSRGITDSSALNQGTSLKETSLFRQ